MTQKLFTLGPVEMFDYTRERLSEQLPYFRTKEFSEIVLECAERLKRLSGAPADSHVYLLTCSGTGAMEAVVGGCFNADDKALVLDGGGFGHRFKSLADHHGIPAEPLKLDFGEGFSLESLDTALTQDSDYTTLLINHHETSTGQLYDLNAVGELCRRHGLYLVCDAISSFLADPLDFEKDGLDALILSAQKALALPPGLSVVILSDRLYRKISERQIKPFSMYFDFIDAEANAVRGQTPYTPAVDIILALRDRLERIENEGGAAASIKKTGEIAQDFRDRIAGLIEKGSLEIPDYPLSNACTLLIFPAKNAGEVYRKLAYEHGFWLNPNGGAIADNVLRVGHLGNLTIGDNALLADLLTEIVSTASASAK